MTTNQRQCVPGGLAILALLATLPVHAQFPPAQDNALLHSRDTTVYLVTFGPGKRAYERYGHNMLWIRSPQNQLDSAWDWGRFSFRTKGFWLRFAQGDLRYWMMSEYGPDVVSRYVSEGRRTTVQRLALSRAQLTQLLAMLRINDTDEFRFYQYHYYQDNCSTRIRDALDAVLGGSLRKTTESIITPWTYRDHTKRLNENNPFLYFVLITLLADPIDQPLTAWNEMFLPSSLMHWIREVTIPSTDGSLVSLVASEQVLDLGTRFSVPDRPSNWLPGFLLVGLTLGASLVGARRAKNPVAMRFFVPIAGAYLLIAGLLALAMTLFWAVSGHEVAWRNENLLQFNLAALALLPLLPSTQRSQPKYLKLARLLACIILGGSVMGLLLKTLPTFDQANWEVIALALPANLGLALGVLWPIPWAQRDSPNLQVNDHRRG